MRLRLWIGAALLLCALNAMSLSADTYRKPARDPRLIEWGWDQPTTKSLRENIAQMEKAPFDGVVLNALGSDRGRNVDFAWDCWSTQTFTREEFAQPVADLKATSFRRFTDNFLRFNVTPGDVDWYDDAGWKAICANGAVGGWICQEGGLKGLMFDTETYKAQTFQYNTQKGHTAHSVAEYQAQARQRGHELATAITREKPDIVLLFTFANSLLTDKNADRAEFRTKFDLLPAFIDGMLEGSQNKTSFVDALEMTYPARSRQQYEEFGRLARGAHTKSQIPDKYKARIQVAFGVWMDLGWSSRGWHPEDPSKNYFQPNELRDAVKGAMAATDKYVWLYSEKVNWWTGAGLSPEYIQAVEAARTSSRSK